MEYWKRFKRVINCPKMPSFKFLVLLSSLLVISLLSLCSGNETPPGYIAHFCSGTNFVANSTYQSNLDLVLSSFSSNATLVTGFSSASAGVVSGIFLCRGDVNATVCQDCVAKVARTISELCSLQTGAIVWYEKCLVRYSNDSIFSTISEVPQAYDKYIGSPWTMPEAEKVRFNELLGSTMHSLATLASNSLTGKKFATEEKEFNSSLLSSRKLYSLVQCTPDLTVSDCNTCLLGAIFLLPTCCDGKQGGWVLRSSCTLRYELYPFYNFTADSEPAFPPLAPGMKRDCDQLNIWLSKSYTTYTSKQILAFVPRIHRAVLII